MGTKFFRGAFRASALTLPPEPTFPGVLHLSPIAPIFDPEGVGSPTNEYYR